MGYQCVARSEHGGGAESVVGDDAFATGARGKAEQLVCLRAVAVIAGQFLRSRQQQFWKSGIDQGEAGAKGGGRIGGGELRHPGKGLGVVHAFITFAQRKMADLSARHFLFTDGNA